MLDTQIIAFSLAAAMLTITPGQDTMLVVRNVLRGGHWDGILTTVGICTGLFMHAMFSAFGVSVILMHSVEAFQLVKFVGAFYLMWLGLRSLQGAVKNKQYATALTRQQDTRSISAYRCLLEGFLSNVLNPKTAIFYLAFLPQFIGPYDSVLQKSLILAGIHYLECILWLFFICLAVNQTRRLFRRPMVRRWLDGALGTVLVGLGLGLALERR